VEAPGIPGLMEFGRTTDPHDATPTQSLARDVALVISLKSGERLNVRLGVDEPTARARLQQIQLDLARESFVRVGDGLVLRADEIQAVEIAREHELDRGESFASWQTGAHEDERYPSWDEPAGGRVTIVDRVVRLVLARVGYVPTAELAATMLGIAGVLLAALLSDDLNASGAWLVIGLILAAYIVSRGISKAGTEGRSGL